MSGAEWQPVHHEDMDEPDQQQVSPEKAAAATKAALKHDKESDGPALVLTIPPTFAAAMWSLSEALRENTEVQRDLLKEMRASRGE